MPNAMESQSAPVADSLKVFGLLCLCTKLEFLFVVGFTEPKCIGHLCSL